MGKLPPLQCLLPRLIPVVPIEVLVLLWLLPITFLQLCKMLLTYCFWETILHIPSLNCRANLYFAKTWEGWEWSGCCRGWAEALWEGKIDDGGRNRREAEGTGGSRVWAYSMRVWTPHLQRGQHYLFHRGEVGFPEELSLLSEGQDLISVDGAHRGRNLQKTKQSVSSALKIAPKDWSGTWHVPTGRLNISPRDTLRKFPSQIKYTMLCRVEQVFGAAATDI